LARFLDRRLGTLELHELLVEKRVPLHRHTVWYFGGGLLLFPIVVQVVTGILLMLYYVPGHSAHASVLQLVDWIDFGWLIRSIHVWSARMLVFVALVHLSSTFFTRAYRDPREVTWWSGLILFALLLLFSFSGSLLPMDTVAFFATTIGIDIVSSVPLVGGAIADLARGGPVVGPHTVQRFYVLHVVVLPAAVFALAAVHLWLVQRHGSAVPPGEAARPSDERRSLAFWPDFVIVEMGLWLAATALLVLLSVGFPAELDAPADPLAPVPEGIHPEWEFMALYQALRVAGGALPGMWGQWVVLGLVFLLAVAAVVLPVVDRAGSSPIRSRLMTLLGVAVLILFAAFTAWGYLDVIQR
jgi:cytochrome b6